MENRERPADTRRTVIIAGAANVLVGLVKLVAPTQHAGVSSLETGEVRRPAAP